MSKTLKLRKRAILVPTIEEASGISDTERQTLRTSLEEAHADIVAGDLDVVTSETLRAEFESLFHVERTDDELEMGARSARCSTPLI